MNEHPTGERQTSLRDRLGLLLLSHPCAAVYVSDGQGHVVEVTSVRVNDEDFVCETTDEIVPAGAIILHS